MRRAGILAGAMLLSALGVAPAGAEPLRVIVDGVWGPQHAPLFLAIERRFFAEAQIEPLVEPGLGGNTVAVMVAQRAFDLGQLPAFTAAAAIGRGAPIRVVAVFQPRTLLAVVGVAARVRLDGPGALAGLRIGVTPGGPDGLAMAIFRRVNSMGTSSLLLMPTDAAAKLPLLIAGKLDAVVADTMTIPAGLRAEGLEPVVLAFADHNVPLMGQGFIAHQAALSANPDLLRRGLGAIRRGFGAAVESPAAACDAMRRRVAMQETPEQCDALLSVYLARTMPASDPAWGRQPSEEWARMIDVMRVAGEIQGTRPVSFYYNNSVLPQIGRAHV